MARPAKRRALDDTDVGLYDQDELDALDIEADDGEEHTNGNTPEGLSAERAEYLETADEDELREIITNIQDVVEILLPVKEWKTKEGKIVTVLLRSMDTFAPPS
jgi:hypothetical protein